MPSPGPLLRAVPLVIAVSLGALGSAACTDDSATQSEAPATSIPPDPTHPSVSAPAPGDTTLAPESAVLRFDAPGDIACASDSASVEVSYDTRNIDAIGFVVDGQSVQTGTAPPTSGSFVVPVPCDGKVHTIMLIGSGAAGPAFATKAVVTRPT